MKVTGLTINHLGSTRSVISSYIANNQHSGMNKMRVYTKEFINRTRCRIDFFSDEDAENSFITPRYNARMFINAHPQFRWIYTETIDIADIRTAIEAWEAAGYKRFQEALITRTMWDD